MEIHQLLAGFRTGDAISNYALELKSIIESLGYKSNIYCVEEHVCKDLKEIALSHHKHQLVSSKENILIYHFSLGSPASECFITAKDRKILIYHNITPAKFFRTINEQTARTLYAGREELKQLSQIPDLALGVSEYNRKELEEADFKKTAVLPLIVSQDYFKIKPSPKILKKANKKITTFVTIGRLVPNKKLEDIIKTFYFYKKCINTNSRLFIVGSYDGTEKYYNYLKALLNELHLNDVEFTKHIHIRDLIGYYHIADAYLCMSEHEGFCIPLLEAIHFKLPLFAFNSSAISETLGGSGVLLQKKDFKRIAELMDIILTNETIKQRLLKKQHERLKNFYNKQEIKTQLANLIASLI